MNDFEALNEICQRRKSVRQFNAQPLSVEQIAAIRDLARTAPYASGKKNWELLVVTEPAVIEELAGIVRRRSEELEGQVRNDFRPMFREYAENFAAFATAPALFVPTFKVQPSLSLLLADATEDLRRWERENYVKSIAGVAMLILLTAESLGLGACCMTGPLLAEKELARRLEVKRGFDIGALIPVGYPNNERK